MFWVILFLILIYFIGAPIFRVWRKMRRFREEYERAMEQQGTYQPEQPNGGRTQEQRERLERYHQYSEENAENVDFEELDGPMSQEPQSADNQSSSSTQYQEEPVSDAEFEEI